MFPLNPKLLGAAKDQLLGLRLIINGVSGLHKHQTQDSHLV